MMDMTVNEGTAFRIKGHRDGLIITVSEGDWQPIVEGMIKHIHERQAFFRGARVALDVGGRSLTITQISSLRDKLSDFDVVLWALQTSDERTTQSVRNLGLETVMPSRKQEQNIKPIDTLIPGEEALFVKKTLRSGYSVVFEGHVIVMGDVNPGAEIIAGGNVIVWGRLRGSIHAGAAGDTSAVVCALEMKPTYVRIASSVTFTPQPKKGKQQPEMVTNRDGNIIAEVWKP